MASLKEVKERIASVNGTLKITSAMKMVASAKLHKAQELIEGMWPYEQRLSRMLEEFLDAYPEMDSQLTAERPVKRVALVVFASNGSLCGGYNANVVRRFREWVEQNLILGKENLVIYPIGKKIEEAVRKAGFTPAETFGRLADKPDREVIAQLADRLTKSFLDGDVDRIDLLFHHFKSTATQDLVLRTYLPVDLSQVRQKEVSSADYVLNYIVEPSPNAFLRTLLPTVLRLKLYTALLDSNASEHAARTMAMQVATDNANDLLQDLTIMYNKSRQQVITNELLDMAGGSMD